MAATLQDFYLKYRNKVMRSLETDPYYEYLFELIESSQNELQQTNRILHKSVDEKWLQKVEEGIVALDAVLNKPRRFIKSDEAVVPIALAKKITSGSVRHLSQNTQFISNIQDGNIMPSKILNVTTEESYDLYENRFIATLIKKLVGFIDKRTDIIFWSTGDEKESLLKVESQVEDDYEEIEYNLQIRIKNKKSYMETDAQHMEVFKRIDRVRRIVLELNKCSFMQIMEGTATVRPPIQRTNLIMKDPNYKKCYNLWLFLEQYDDIGYSIDVKETALDFDEDYLYQVYSNMITGYTVFKTILDDDRRPIDTNVKRRKKIKPKFVKQIVEEFVDDYDIPDVEIRKVIIEEITKAQMEIERRQAEEEKKKLAKEKEKEKERLMKEKEKEKERLAKEKERAIEKAKLDKEKARLKKLENQEKAKERERLAKERQEEKLRLAKEKEEEKLRLAKEKAKAIEKAKRDKEKAIEKAKRDKEKAIEKAKKDKEKALEKAKAEKEKARLKKLAEQEKEKAAAKKEKEKAKELEKERLAKEKAKETEKLAKEKEKVKETEKLAKEKEKAKETEKLAKEKEKAKETQELAKEKEKALEVVKTEKQKELEKAKPDTEEALEEIKREKEKMKIEREKAREKLDWKMKRKRPRQR
ncbi:MAG: hypothetical protein RR361_00990 [Anaerovorax sp.]